LATFAALIEKLHESIDLPLPELVEHVVDVSTLRSHYQNEKEGQDRVANLDELINAAASFVAEEGRPGEEGELAADLASFLSHSALEAGEHQAGEGDDALQLMTVHSAKGLEFNAVFMSGLEEGLFPHENSALEQKGLEEERRLMYVAVTRARQRLYLSFAQTRMLHGQTRYNMPSRFIEEIPVGLLKWLTPKINKSAPSGRWADSNSGDDVDSYRPTARADSGIGFRIGQSVRHAKFGPGVIVNAEGGGNDARVQVNFGNAGMKWLALSIAKLDAA
jgi:DNA helicase-2/ATP-dependent DNA helicase PcrA